MVLAAAKLRAATRSVERILAAVEDATMLIAVNPHIFSDIIERSGFYGVASVSDSESEQTRNLSERGGSISFQVSAHAQGTRQPPARVDPLWNGLLKFKAAR